MVRYFTDVLGGHEITRKVITLGTPHRGAANALDSLVNGVSKGWGPVKVDLTELARSLPGLFELLPEYHVHRERRRSAQDHRGAGSRLDTTMIAEAMRFHDELRTGAEAHGGDFDVHPILARTQPTWTTARISGGHVTLVRTFEGRDDGGDGTVPRLSASPYAVEPSSPTLRYVMDKHGGLPATNPASSSSRGCSPPATSSPARPSSTSVWYATT